MAKRTDVAMLEFTLHHSDCNGNVVLVAVALFSPARLCQSVPVFTKLPLCTMCQSVSAQTFTPLNKIQVKFTRAS